MVFLELVDHPPQRRVLSTHHWKKGGIFERVMPVHEAVHVEYFLPGCPPSAARIKSLISQMLSGAAPKLEGVNLKFG